MRVIIQIPCFNEEDCLLTTLHDLPRKLNGVDEVFWLVINDGSKDRTVEVAIQNGADCVVSHTRNLGLSRAFQTGLEACLWLGADIIVNTDADNQYNAEDIQKLIDPILQGKADYVVGARPIKEIEHFSPIKKFLQKAGSKVVSRLSQIDIEDTTSGFRAMNRRTALKLNVFNEYTYTLETLIQSGQMKIATVFIPIRVNAKTRPSRLISSTMNYLRRSAIIIFRSFLTYKPLKIFSTIGSIAILLAFVIMVRYLHYYFKGEGTGHIQSLLLAIILFIFGTSAWMFGMQADLISVNRRLIEDVSQRVKRLESKILNESAIDLPDLTDARWDFLKKKNKT
ncbi:MAG TPA: glycosyltransferase family 2 protein [Anaerolineaceae bacterium]|nr:glycosyltransferase family 2 protein [Anaerolineaceae bacterium]